MTHSPTALAGHLSCPHLTQLGRQRRAGTLQVEFPPDPRVKGLQERGRPLHQLAVGDELQDGRGPCLACEAPDNGAVNRFRAPAVMRAGGMNMREVLQVKVSIEGAPPPVWRRILVPANLTLRQTHRMLEEAFGRKTSAGYFFAQDGRLFGNPALHDDYIEDDAAFRLNYCLCQPGHTLEYVFGPWRHSILLESMGPGQAKQWRLMEGEGAPAPAEAM